jgi:hypothetical protein
MVRPQPSFEVHAFLACRNIQWDGPAGPNTSRTLEQVGYTYRTDVPNGFPFETDFWLFVRLAHHRRREFTRKLQLTMIWADDPQRRPEVWSRPFQTITFRPTMPVRDIAASLPSVIFEGPGRYEFRLWHPVVRKWDQATKRRTLARTHIRIEG